MAVALPPLKPSHSQLNPSQLVLPNCSAEEEKVEVDDDEDFDEERATLIVRRVVADTRPLAGKQTTVTISLYNAGNA